MENNELKRGSYQKYPYHKGQVIDAITILEDNFVYVDGRYMVKFQCRCGKVDYKRLSELQKMQFKCCRYCGRKNNYPDKRKSRGYFDENNMHKTWLSVIKQNLNRGSKHIECTIIMQDLYETLKKQNFKCAYTGESLDVVGVLRDHSNGSVDRIDSSKGYTPENIQWVYKPINIMKNSFPDDVFKNLCCKVADFTRQS